MRFFSLAYLEHCRDLAQLGLLPLGRPLEHTIHPATSYTAIAWSDPLHTYAQSERGLWLSTRALYRPYTFTRQHFTRQQLWVAPRVITLTLPCSRMPSAPPRQDARTFSPHMKAAVGCTLPSRSWDGWSQLADYPSWPRWRLMTHRYQKMMRVTSEHHLDPQI